MEQEESQERDTGRMLPIRPVPEVLCTGKRRFCRGSGTDTDQDRRVNMPRVNRPSLQNSQS
jgi:hypothetical protein